MYMIIFIYILKGQDWDGIIAENPNQIRKETENFW